MKADHERAMASAQALDCGAGDTVRGAEALTLARAYLEDHAEVERLRGEVARRERQYKTCLSDYSDECGRRDVAEAERDAAIRRAETAEQALRDCLDWVIGTIRVSCDCVHVRDQMVTRSVVRSIANRALLGPSPCEHEWVPVTPGTGAPFMCSQCGVDLDDEDSEPPEGTETEGENDDDQA